jgi:hypothetical protein
MAQLAVIASEATGREVRHTTVTDEDWRDAKIAGGMPAMYADMLVGTFRAARQGNSAATDPALGSSLGRPPRDDASGAMGGEIKHHKATPQSLHCRHVGKAEPFAMNHPFRDARDWQLSVKPAVQRGFCKRPICLKLRRSDLRSRDMNKRPKLGTGKAPASVCLWVPTAPLLRGCTRPISIVLQSGSDLRRRTIYLDRYRTQCTL